MFIRTLTFVAVWASCSLLSAAETRLNEHLSVFHLHDHNLVLGLNADGQTFRLHNDFRRNPHLAGTPAEIHYIGKNETRYLADPIEAYWKHHAEKGWYNVHAGISQIPTAKLEGVIGVAEGDIIDPDRNKIHVIDTPGMTQNSVSYYADIDGKRIVFCGNLIYGNGGLSNLYDLQDAMPEQKIGAYHGYMARGLALIDSLEKIKKLEPHQLIPAKGPVIDNPAEAIDTLIGRLRSIYENYIATTALWWYFPDSMLPAAQKFAGKPNLPLADIRRMKQGKLHDKPAWLHEFGTTRLIASESKAAFVIDCAGQASLNRIDQLIEDGTISTVEGIYISHYHNDHTASVPALADKFQCPVYCDEIMRQILKQPRDFHMPVLDPQSIETQGFQTMRWHEFTLTSFFFPGQTLYHSALLVAKEGERPVLFVGDSFTPTGIDDYCLWNRNFPGDNEGYLYCLELIRKMEPRPFLVNQHVSPLFEFDDEQIDYMVNALKERRKILATLFPYASPELGNGVGFGVDSIWARFEPHYVSAGSDRQIGLVVRNHADRPLSFYVFYQTEDGQRRGELIFRDVPAQEEQRRRFFFPQIKSDAVKPFSAIVRCVEIPSLEIGVEVMIGR